MIPPSLVVKPDFTNVTPIRVNSRLPPSSYCSTHEGRQTPICLMRNSSAGSRAI
ncbi:hypothetical protein L211DRAFT_527555 [Terfezia boudieri ATCC MYA-4762]|uniref:Uncharacterized protein n=1 Tax=Terfezia boudieri ATCC MYA-4762 TaxID=1051890 RepID=A0A3N4LCA5_9PEZI|nr:hypothetical protein L211DRAFT_527555 [Terfezia boudieri ATCC MYA-4762]